jgi:hypothetical protein
VDSSVGGASEVELRQVRSGKWHICRKQSQQLFARGVKERRATHNMVDESRCEGGMGSGASVGRCAVAAQ